VKEASGPTFANWGAASLPLLKGFHETTVGGRFAARLIEGSAGNCDWTIIVPGKRELVINTWDRDEEAKQGPEDAKYPLLSIIKSITFDPSFPK